MLPKCKYKQRYLSQNNSLLKFRNVSDETNCTAVNKILKNGVTEDSILLGTYAVPAGTFRTIKKCNIILLLRLHEHEAEGTKQPQ